MRRALRAPAAGIGPERSRALSEQAGRGYNGIKPGRLLDAYRFDPRSGQWRHRAAPPDPVGSLTDLLDGRPAPGPGPDAGDEVLSGYLEQARAVLAAAGPAAADPGPGWLPPELERLREFHLPPA